MGLIIAPLILDSFPECFSGVLQPIEEIPAFFRWLSYFAPHAYAADVSGNIEMWWVAELKAAMQKSGLYDRECWQYWDDAKQEMQAGSGTAGVASASSGTGVVSVSSGLGGTGSRTSSPMLLSRKPVNYGRAADLSVEQKCNVVKAWEGGHFDSPFSRDYDVFGWKFEALPQFFTYVLVLVAIFVICRLIAVWNLKRLSQSLY